MNWLKNKLLWLSIVASMVGAAIAEIFYGVF